MNDQKNSPQDHTKSPVPANQPNEKRGHEKPAEGQANTTGALPGTPQRNEQGKPMANADERAKHDGPNPGPGVSSQGHRVDEDTTAKGNDEDKERKQPNAKQDLPATDQPRDQDKDREEPLKGHKVGDEKPAHSTKARA